MKRSLALVVIGVIVLSLLITGIVLYHPPCSAVKIISASIKVRTPPDRLMLGLNADTDALKFGIVSPGLVATRKVIVQHQKKATISITMNGELSPWTAISPAQFEVQEGEAQEVLFDVEVPAGTAVGEYTGNAVFCIKD